MPCFADTHVQPSYDDFKKSKPNPKEPTINYGLFHRDQIHAEPPLPKLATVEDEEDSELDADASDLLEPCDVAITEPPETNRSRSKL